MFFCLNFRWLFLHAKLNTICHVVPKSRLNIGKCTVSFMRSVRHKHETHDGVLLRIRYTEPICGENKRRDGRMMCVLLLMQTHRAQHSVWNAVTPWSFSLIINCYSNYSKWSTHTHTPLLGGTGIITIKSKRKWKNIFFGSTRNAKAPNWGETCSVFFDCIIY